MNPHGRLNFEIISFQLSLESADPSIKLTFYWHHLGFYNESKDRLRIEMKFSKGL